MRVIKQTNHFKSLTKNKEHTKEKQISQHLCTIIWFASTKIYPCTKF